MEGPEALNMNVKTVSYGDKNAARDFTRSLLETGFAVLTNHPVPVELIQNTYKEWGNFFADSSKNDYIYDAKTQAGYFPFRSENAKDSAVKDLKEFFHYYPARTTLPLNSQRFTPEYYKRVTGLGSELLSWIQEETPEHVSSRFPMPLSQMIERSEETLLRILHYPPLKGDEQDGAVRAGAHEDINLITLLSAATAPGLEVKDMAGNWHAVSCDPGMIVINSGDMLKKTSRGFYPSTTHRVVNPSGPAAREARYSMPLFLHPRRDAHLTDTVTAGEYLSERLQQIGLLK
jgi:isopenicillin N synthase-like dioxygenase